MARKILVAQLSTEPVPLPAVEAWSLNLWTISKVHTFKIVSGPSFGFEFQCFKKAMPRGFIQGSLSASLVTKICCKETVQRVSALMLSMSGSWSHCKLGTKGERM